MYAYTAKGLGPSAGVFSGWTLIWAYFFIAVAGMCGFAVFCAQLLSALGYHGSVHPIIFFAISAVACWVIAYKDIRVSSILTMVLEAASVACITALAFVILFKHGFSVDTKQLSLSGVNVRGMGLAVVACIFSLVGFEAATTMGAEAKNPRRNLPRAVIASLLITGAFMVFMAYVEVSGTSNYGSAWTSAPLNYLAVAYNVSWFRIPVSIGAMVSFFSLSLSCLNAGSRIMYPMARHGIFSGHLGKAHVTNRTPHVAVTVYIAMIFALPAFLMIFTNPLTAFGDAGTLAAFGFLVAYYLITVAAPVYLKKLGELSWRNVVLACIAVLCLLVPTIGSFYPQPPYPVNLFPYVFLGWMWAPAGCSSSTAASPGSCPTSKRTWSGRPSSLRRTSRSPSSRRSRPWPDLSHTPQRCRKPRCSRVNSAPRSLHSGACRPHNRPVGASAHRGVGRPTRRPARDGGLKTTKRQHLSGH